MSSPSPGAPSSAPPPSVTLTAAAARGVRDRVEAGAAAHRVGAVGRRLGDEEVLAGVAGEGVGAEAAAAGCPIRSRLTPRRCRRRRRAGRGRCRLRGGLPARPRARRAVTAEQDVVAAEAAQRVVAAAAADDVAARPSGQGLAAVGAADRARGRRGDRGGGHEEGRRDGAQRDQPRAGKHPCHGPSSARRGPPSRRDAPSWTTVGSHPLRSLHDPARAVRVARRRGHRAQPCVLPVLPALLSAGATGGRRRPLGIVIGLAVDLRGRDRRPRDA